MGKVLLGERPEEVTPRGGRILTGEGQAASTEQEALQNHKDPARPDNGGITYEEWSRREESGRAGAGHVHVLPDHPG